MRFFGFVLLGSLVLAGLDEQKILQCHVSNREQARAFQRLDVFSFDAKERNFTVRVVDSKQYSLVQQASKCTVLNADLGSMLGFRKSRRKRHSQHQDFFLGYQSYSTMRRMLAKLSKQYPNITTFIPTIGKSHEGRNIFAFKISTKKGTNKKGIWFNAGQHAREWISPSASIYTIYKLLLESETPKVKRLLDSFEFHFTPLANPDGYEFSRLPGNRLWRKNRRNNGDGTFGVDLNRNWEEHWGLVGGSERPSDEVYRGLFPHSEPEVRALAAYARSITRCYGGIDFHSYGQYIMRSWRWTTRRSTNEKVLIDLSNVMQRAFQIKGQNYTPQTSADLYPASGTLDDWMSLKANLVSLSIELCPHEYFPYNFQLPSSQIVSCSEGAYAAILSFSEFLLKHPNIPPNSLSVN